MKEEQMSKTPEEPGWYRYRRDYDHRWRCVYVYWDDHEYGFMVREGLYGGGNYIENYPGEYIGPIPEPEEAE